VVSLSEIDPSGGATAAVFDAASSNTTPLVRHGSDLFSVAIHSGGGVVVGGGRDRVVRVAGPSGGEPHLLFGHLGVIYSVAISPDGRWIASGSQDATVRLWRVPTGTPLQALPLPRFLEVMRQNCPYVYHKDPNASGGFDAEYRSFGGWDDFPEY
jgi:WD40 repeat protein